MTTEPLSEQLERLRRVDLEGYLADAIRDLLRLKFSTIISFDLSERMAKAALAEALRAKEGE
jgi:hypothetical protein